MRSEEPCLHVSTRLSELDELYCTRCLKILTEDPAFSGENQEPRASHRNQVDYGGVNRQPWDCSHGRLVPSREFEGEDFCTGCGKRCSHSKRVEAKGCKHRETAVNGRGELYCRICFKNLTTGESVEEAEARIQPKGSASQRDQADDRGSNQRTPHVCPKCNGEGKVHNLRPAHNIMPDLTDAIPEKCHPCGGTGIVWG